MSFADQLRKTTPQANSKSDSWRRECELAVREICSQVERGCLVAAQSGARTAQFSYSFDKLFHKELVPPYDYESSFFGIKKSEHPHYTILLEVISAHFVPYISKLGLTYQGITTHREVDTYYCGTDYSITLSVGW